MYCCVWGAECTEQLCTASEVLSSLNVCLHPAQSVLQEPQTLQKSFYVILDKLSLLLLKVASHLPLVIFNISLEVS